MIATNTSSVRSYTDTRPSGIWWYKVKATNSYGSSSYSNIVSVQEILTSSVTINSPHNITYKGTISGHFYATYSFENDYIGESPSG